MPALPLYPSACSALAVPRQGRGAPASCVDRSSAWQMAVPLLPSGQPSLQSHSDRDSPVSGPVRFGLSTPSELAAGLSGSRLLVGMQFRGISLAGLGAVVGLVLVAASASANSGGGIPFARNGDWFPSEGCTQCHRGGTLNSPTAMSDVLINGSAAAEYAYTPGETVSVTINFTDTAAVRVGFLFMARSDDAAMEGPETYCGSGGMMAPGASEAGARVKVRNGDFLRTKPEPCGDRLNDIWWATHTRATTGNSAEWEVAWTLPASNVGPITALVIGNGGNGNGSASGDNIHSKVLTIHPFAEPEPPMITGGGHVLAGLGSEDSPAMAAPGAVASVTGTGFAGPGEARHATLDEEGRLPTVLDGTCVEVGGMHRAHILQIAAEQVTFLIPSEIGVGTSMVKVVRECDTDGQMASNSLDFTVDAMRPVMLEYPASTPGLVALRSNLDLVAPIGALDERPTLPAAPGEVVSFFGTGLGAVSPPYGAGQVPSELRPLATADLRLMLGEMELDGAHLLYAGSAPHGAGLSQFIVEIPETVPAGTHALSLLSEGVVSLAGPALHVDTVEARLPATACTTGLELKPKDRCHVPLGEADGILEISGTGSACVLPSVDSPGSWMCGVELLDLAAYDAGIESAGEGAWTITKMPTLPEPMDEEVPKCEVDLVVKPGERCEATIAGQTGVFAVDEEGEACVTVAGGLLPPFCGAQINVTLGAFGAEVEKNDDGSWTVKRLP